MVTWQWPRLTAVAPCGLVLYPGSPVRLELGWLGKLGESKFKGLKRYDIFKYIIDIVDVLLQNRFLHNMDLDVFDKLVVKT